MRKMLSALAFLAALSAAAYFLKPVAISADLAKNNRADSAAAPPCSRLPIAQVVLFSSGVGYFQREGSVEGNTRIDLSFPVENINDLLKSMVLRDLDGGVISTVSYDSNAPLEKTIKSFAINLSGNPAFNQILNQARGEKVEVVLQSANATQPGTLTGTIVGVEQQKQAAGKETLEVNLLNLWCADGMRSLVMSDIQRVRFLNPLLDSEFKKALETLAASHDTQKKIVSINCAGEGKRNIKVGYVVENPIWKTSYRLVLDKDKKEKPFLQGWAIVENPTDEDWKDVRMALISGRPISFQMDLYQPLYVPRPVVEPELFASLRPVAYSGSLQKNNAVAATKNLPDTRLTATYDFNEVGRRIENVNVGGVNGLPTMGGYSIASTGGTPVSTPMGSGLATRMDLAKNGAQSMATAAKLGDFFQYTIDKPVSLPRQKSAMLPIVNKDVEGTRVSIYNERAQAKFPLLGLKFKNTSGLHLMQGPITVFEGSNYAGDARILDLQPDEERLISYAVDLGTEVNPVPSSDNGRIVCVKVVKGTIQTTNKIRESKTYTIVNRNDGERVVLVEHPVRNEFKLVDTVKPAETASDCYRFEVKVAAGKTETLTVTEEQMLCTSVEMLNTDDKKVAFFLTQPAVSQAVKDGLKKAQALRGKLEKTQREIAEQEVQLKALTEDQVRLRANLHEMPATSAAYKRYLDKFDQQETQIENYQNEIKNLQKIQVMQRKVLEDFLEDFSVE
jgi:hypothetical protein